MTDKILTHVENHIGWVIYNNAEKRNAVSMAMAADMPRTLLPA